MSRIDNADTLIARARRETGIEIADEDAREPLTRLITSFNDEGQLSEAGAAAMQDRLLRVLANRLRMFRDFAAHPEIGDQPVDRPIIICGMPRTGSTKTHKMLAASGAFNWLPYWQALNPASWTGKPDEDVSERIGDVDAFATWFDAISPQTRAGHAFETHEPEEESFLLEHSLISPVFMGWSPMPSYLGWLQQADMTAQFGMLRRMLQYLQWQGLASPERRWVLKSPLYTGLEPLLLQTFPDACLLMTHRDPLTTVPSALKLLEMFHRPFSQARPDPSFYLGGLSAATQAHMTWRAGMPKGKILDLPFRMLVEQAEEVSRAIFDHVGHPLSSEVLGRMLEWDRTNVQHKNGRHEYSMAEYKFDAASIHAAMPGYSDFVASLAGTD